VNPVEPLRRKARVGEVLMALPASTTDGFDLVVLPEPGSPKPPSSDGAGAVPTTALCPPAAPLPPLSGAAVADFDDLFVDFDLDMGAPLTAEALQLHMQQQEQELLAAALAQQQLEQQQNHQVLQTAAAALQQQEQQLLQQQQQQALQQQTLESCSHLGPYELRVQTRLFVSLFLLA
jgi:hypothetical protein